MAAVALTIWAKTVILAQIDFEGMFALRLAWVVAFDIAIYLGLGAMFAVVEAKSRRFFAITLPLAFLFAVLATLNAAYLSRVGEQLTWNAITLGIHRADDLGVILRERIVHLSIPITAAAAGFLIVIPVVAAFVLRRSRIYHEPRRPFHHGRAHSAGMITIVALLVRFVVPSPIALPIERLGANATLNTYWGWITEAEPPVAIGNPLSDQPPVALVEEHAITQFAARSTRPNILVVVLESTRFDFTSLSGPESPAETPTLAALAQRGVNVEVTRAVLPHTTKSLFSILCARLPMMQQAIVEVSQTIDIQCLPDVLAKAGYQTGFFQSALGTFENRPRLVDKFGFQHFAAWEDIGGQPLGYLASDDESLSGAFSQWVRQIGSGPFFATLLTSAAHDPYRLSDAIKQRIAKLGKPDQTVKDRYARLIEAEDILLGQLIATLQERKLLENTIVVVLGDHGEGFGDKGVRQHDNNFYEEGLRVPWVMAGPGVPRRTVRHNASLVDVTPTLLDVLDISLAPSIQDGVSALASVDGAVSRPRWFSCWYDSACRGFVLHHDKVVHIPATGQSVRFDLLSDPSESRPLPLTDELRELLPQMHQEILSRRVRQRPVLGEIRKYGDWRCPSNARCFHPKSPKGFFTQSSPH